MLYCLFYHWVPHYRVFNHTLWILPVWEKNALQWTLLFYFSYFAQWTASYCCSIGIYFLWNAIHILCLTCFCPWFCWFRALYPTSEAYHLWSHVQLMFLTKVFVCFSLPTFLPYEESWFYLLQVSSVFTSRVSCARGPLCTILAHFWWLRSFNSSSLTVCLQSLWLQSRLTTKCSRCFSSQCAFMIPLQ